MTLSYSGLARHIAAHAGNGLLKGLAMSLEHLNSLHADHVSRSLCPLCSGSLQRVQRHPFDRFINIFLPVHRYRCASLGCSWEGTLLVRRKLSKNDDASHHDR
jgi:hypothetical protein